MSPASPTRSIAVLPAKLRARYVLAAGLLGAAMWTLGGCSEALLSPKDERSPFDRYDAVRQQYAPQFVEDEYGRRQPNLRGRLAPKK